MFEPVEVQHPARLHLTRIGRAVLVGKSAFGSSVAHAHHSGVGTEGMAVLELAVYGQLHATVPLIVQQEIHIVDLVNVCVIDVLFFHLPCSHIQILRRLVGRAVLVCA